MDHSVAKKRMSGFSVLGRNHAYAVGRGCSGVRITLRSTSVHVQSSLTFEDFSAFQRARFVER